MKKRWMITMFAIAAMTSCSKEIIEEEKASNSPDLIKFNAGVLDIVQQAKALTTGTTLPDGIMGVYAWTGNTSDFTEATHTNLNNAAITVSTDGTKFEFEAGKDAYWPFDGNLDFYAYYPQVTGENLIAGSASSTPKIKIALADQKDYMWAAPVKAVSKSASAVAFQFKHALSAITINVKKDANAGNVNLTAIKIASYNETAEMDIATGTLTQTGTAVAYDFGITAADITTAGSSFVTDRLIWPGAAPTLTLTLNGVDKTVTPKDGANALNFVANQKHTITITITQSGIDVSATSTDWSEGTSGSGSI